MISQPRMLDKIIAEAIEIVKEQRNEEKESNRDIYFWLSFYPNSLPSSKKEYELLLEPERNLPAGFHLCFVNRGAMKTTSTIRTASIYLQEIISDLKYVRLLKCTDIFAKNFRDIENEIETIKEWNLC